MNTAGKWTSMEYYLGVLVGGVEVECLVHRAAPVHPPEHRDELRPQAATQRLKG